MNEKLQYATMLEIPVNTCNVTYTPIKKKKKSKKKTVNHESVKEELLNKINSDLDEQNALNFSDDNPQVYQEITDETQDYQESENIEKPSKGKFKFTVIGAELCVIGALIATIFLTNAFYPNSGINVFMREVFGNNNSQTVTIDERLYSEFAPVITLSDGTTCSAESGVISISGTGSVYAPVSGKVSSISQDENGKFNIEVLHSENFKTLITGVDFAYVGLDDDVYYNIPVGYTDTGEVEMCFTGENGASIVDYEILDNSVVWSV